MRQIRFDFSDETDKVLMDTQNNKVSTTDLLALIRGVTTIILDVVNKNNGPIDVALASITKAVSEGCARFEKNDIIRSPEDLSPWRKEANND